MASKVDRDELSGEGDADERYFGGVRNGRRERGAAGKVPVCGLLKRGGTVRDVSEFHHRRVNHSNVFVSPRGHHINGIEHVWSQANRHLRRFNGIPREDSIYWFLKACDWRFNGDGPTAWFHQLNAWYRAAINRS
jgi:transposase